MSVSQDGKPPLAGLVCPATSRKEAEAITDFIFMAKDISNAYLVTTRAGDVMVNTGFMDNAQRTKSCSRPTVPERCATSSSLKRTPITTAACRRCARPARK
jgi:predicted aconitase